MYHVYVLDRDGESSFLNSFDDLDEAKQAARLSIGDCTFYFRVDNAVVEDEYGNEVYVI